MLLWLGEAGEYTDRLFEVAAKAVPSKDTIEDIWQPYSNEVNLSDEEAAVVEAGMNNVLSRSYWRRRWDYPRVHSRRQD